MEKALTPKPPNFHDGIALYFEFSWVYHSAGGFNQDLLDPEFHLFQKLSSQCFSRSFFVSHMSTTHQNAGGWDLKCFEAQRMHGIESKHFVMDVEVTVCSLVGTWVDSHLFLGLADCARVQLETRSFA